MATVTRRLDDVAVLRRVPYKVYVRLSRAWANRHLRMAYHDGTLEIASPRRREHEKPSRRLSILVTTVAELFGIDYEGSGATTFRSGGKGPFRGIGKEPDQSFYMASLPRLPEDREVDLDAGDPPPDLWIEVDNRVSSAGRLPVYSALGVPEVWRYRSQEGDLQFLRLVGTSYEVIDRSIALPALTPALVLEALRMGDGLSELKWLQRLRDWSRGLGGPPVVEPR